MFRTAAVLLMFRVSFATCRKFPLFVDGQGRYIAALATNLLDQQIAKNILHGRS
jgi:hypothetical protein